MRSSEQAVIHRHSIPFAACMNLTANEFVELNLIDDYRNATSVTVREPLKKDAVWHLRCLLLILLFIMSDMHFGHLARSSQLENGRQSVEPTASEPHLRLGH